jgi:hypothetical protein
MLYEEAYLKRLKEHEERIMFKDRPTEMTKRQKEEDILTV